MRIDVRIIHGGYIYQCLTDTWILNTGQEDGFVQEVNVVYHPILGVYTAVLLLNDV